jgi:hypothetical protein
MEAWAQELVELWRNNRELIASVFQSAAGKNPDMPIKYQFEDWLQMVDGGAAMVAEYLEGTTTDIWDTYINTVVPGVLSQGQPLSGVIGQLTMNGMLIHSLLVPLAADEHRELIATALINYYVKFNSEVVKIGLELGVKT